MSKSSDSTYPKHQKAEETPDTTYNNCNNKESKAELSALSSQTKSSNTLMFTFELLATEYAESHQNQHLRGFILFIHLFFVDQYVERPPSVITNVKNS